MLILIFFSRYNQFDFFSNEYKNMKDKYFSHNWLLREQEHQV